MKIAGEFASMEKDDGLESMEFPQSPSSPPKPPPFPRFHGRGWEIVETGASASAYDEGYAVFPPSLHEGLHLKPDREPSPEPPLDRRRDPAGVVDDEVASNAVRVRREEGGENLVSWEQFSDTAKRLIWTGIEVFNSKVLGCRGGRRLDCWNRRKVWSFAAMAGLMGALLYVRKRRRREKELLFLLMQEKDQRISDLLNQIALLNEIFAARHQVSITKQ